MIPTSLASMSTLRNVWIQNNNLDRDSINHAIISTPLTQLTTLQKDNQKDIVAPIISSPQIVGSNDPSVFNLSFTINENSYLSGIVSGSAITRSWGLAVVTWSSNCQLVSTTPVLIQSWIATIVLTAADDGVLSNCILSVYDRALNKSNNLIIPSVMVDLWPLRLWLQASTWVELSNSQVLSWTDGSPFKKKFTPASGQPTMIFTWLNGYPVINFTPSNYLVGSWIIWVASITDLTIFAVIEDVWWSKEWYKEYGTNGSIIQTTNPWSTISTSVLNTNFVSNQRYIWRTDYTALWQHYSYVNSILVNSASAGSYTPMTNPIQTKLWGFNGKIAEIMVYSKPITPNNKEATQSYLSLKYALPMVSSRNYRKGDATLLWDTNENSEFAYNIIWVGRDWLFGLNQLNSKSRYSSVILSTPSLSDQQYVLLWDNNGALSWVSGWNWISYLGRQFLIRPTKSSTISLSLPVSMLGSGLIRINYEFGNNSSFSTITKSGSLIFNNTLNSRVISGVTIASDQFVRLSVGNASITSLLRRDDNRDGLLSPSENTITVAATLGIYSCDNLTNGQSIPNGYSLNQLGTITQAVNGVYKVQGLSAGRYFIRLEQGWVINTQTKATRYHASWDSIIWARWSQYQNYRAWTNETNSTLRYWLGMLPITLSESDNDIDTNMQTTCMTLDNVTNISDIGIGIYENKIGNLLIQQSISSWWIINDEGEVITLTVSTTNQSSYIADHVEIISSIPNHFIISQVKLNNELVSYVTSGNLIKIPIDSILSNSQAQIVIMLTYDGYLNSNVVVPLVSTWYSWLNETVINDNTASNTFTIIAGTKPSIIGKLWIDKNDDGKYQAGETGTWWIAIELRSCANITLVNNSAELPAWYSWTLAKAVQYTSSTWLYIFEWMASGQYYLSVPSIPFGYAFVAQHVWGLLSGNNNNINPWSNLSNCFRVKSFTESSVDVGIVAINQNVACSKIIQKKIRQGKSYAFTDELQWSYQPYKVGRITIVQTEKNNYNNSNLFAQYQIYNGGLWSDWTAPGLIKPWFAWSIVEVLGWGYNVMYRPELSNPSWDVTVNFQYLMCNQVIQGICAWSYAMKNCYQYQITSCGDGIKDTYNPNDYVGNLNRWEEQCDYGADNGTVNTRWGTQKCTIYCMYETDSSEADLYVDKRVVRRNMCALPSWVEWLLILPSAATWGIQIASWGLFSWTTIINVN